MIMKKFRLLSLLTALMLAASSAFAPVRANPEEEPAPPATTQASVPPETTQPPETEPTMPAGFQGDASVAYGSRTLDAQKPLSDSDATIIRQGVKLDNLIQIGHNVEIGSNTVMSAQVGIAGTSKIGSNCFVAGQVGVADHVTVGNRVQIASKTGIDKNVPDGEIRFGYPALPGLQYHRSFAVFRQLPDLAAKVRELEKRLKAVEQ